MQNEMRLRIAQYGHQITQGATGVANLPLWMSSTMLGKWGTVFHRIAYSMTTNYNQNIVKPLINHNNPLPLLRYSLSHILSGYALWQLSDWLLGQETPHKAFNNEEDYNATLGRIVEYGYRGEFGAGFSLLINPMRRKNNDSSVLGNLINEIGIVNIRNMENLASNAIAFANGHKYLGQTAEDMAKGSITLANHSMRLFYKQKNPYLTNHQNVRKALNTYVSDYGLEKDYGGAGISLNENSPIYRKLRHAFMMGKAEGENGYINTYWSAYYEFLDNALQENPGISYKGAKKIAETKLRSHIQSYDPIFFSENSEKGKIHIRQFEKRLTPEYKALLKKLKTEYKYKVRKFKRDIERTASRFTYK